MRAPFLIAVVAVLSGCAHEDTVQRDISRLPSRHCAISALQRTEDARLAGYDSDQTKIFDDIYMDCVRWDQAHRIY
jgi:hypothetical protein